MTDGGVKQDLVNRVSEVIRSLEIRVETNPFITTCELSGCERVAIYTIESPDNKHYTITCQFHVTLMLLEFAYKEIDRRFDRVYCAECESRAYACDCEYPVGKLEINATYGKRID